MSQSPEDRQLIVPSEHGVVPIQPAQHDLEAARIDIRDITTLITQRGVLIPAGEGREPVRILKRPGYLRWEHRISLVEVDVSKTRKSPPVFYAVYLMGIDEPVREVRSIKLPVQTGGALMNTEEEIFGQMIADGHDAFEVRRSTEGRRVASIVGWSAGQLLLGLFSALKYGHFETSGTYNGVTRVQSGWRESDEYPLVVWSNWKAPWYALFDKENQVEVTREAIISDPFTQQLINAADSPTLGLLENIMARNRGRRA